MTSGPLAAIPAAGAGLRMGDPCPKQYLLIQGRTVLEHSVSRLLEAGVRRLVVAVAPEDQRWRVLPIAGDERVRFITGGSTRQASVSRALDTLAAEHDEDEWVLVHDAVRPCVSTMEIRRLIEALSSYPEGGLLALPLTDTLKRGSNGSAPVAEGTLDRERLFRAQTPQMFRLGPLRRALGACLDDPAVTDESAAMERAGFAPLLVPGNSANIKITYPDDLRLARLLLSEGGAAA